MWYYKLTKLNGVGLFEPYWCSVKYGPWSAIVEETESCIPHAPALWSLYIAEMPEVTMSWYGLWSDIPSYPSLHVFTGTLGMVGHSDGCCPGFYKCLESCIDMDIKCKDTVPA